MYSLLLATVGTVNLTAGPAWSRLPAACVVSSSEPFRFADGRILADVPPPPPDKKDGRPDGLHRDAHGCGGQI